ncbi:MAG TPA: hypothetical protein VGH62_01460 [Bradyrhizobium sp.]|jgi:hypothetical protein
MGKLICEIMVQGEQLLASLTTAAGVEAYMVKTTPGVGKPFWYWPSIPPGKVIAADFTNAPIASADLATNKANIAAITAQPADVLTYDTGTTGSGTT